MYESQGGELLRRSSSIVPDAFGSIDSWISQKLKHEWSSYEIGSVLTPEKVAEAVPMFQHLETPIKVRFLLTFLYLKKEDFEKCKYSIVELIDIAERDTEEWVKIGAGLVKRYLFEEKANQSDTFLSKQLEKTAEKILAVVEEKKQTGADQIKNEFFCIENAYLHQSLRPNIFINPTLHFNISDIKIKEDDQEEVRRRGESSKKNPIQRPQVPLRTYSNVSSGATRLTPTGKLPPPKKSMTELSSEIRRKADAGRFKRQRSRISMIDIDEVKQIESEKAQKAEERKKQKKASASAGASTAASGTSCTSSNPDGNDQTDASAQAVNEQTMITAMNKPNDLNRGISSSRSQELDYRTKEGAQALLRAAFPQNEPNNNPSNEYGANQMQYGGYHQGIGVPGAYGSQFTEQHEAHFPSGGFMDEQQPRPPHHDGPQLWH